MLARLLIGLALCGVYMWGGQEGQAASDLQALYDAHQWFELRERLAAGSGPGLYQGAVAAAFNQAAEAEAALKPIIDKGSDSDANAASDWLSYMYLRSGQYRKAAVQMDDDSALAKMVRGLPDQTVGKFEPSRIAGRIHQRKLFVPVSIQGKAAEFFIDSDANFSFMSEGEARSLGLTVRETTAKIHGVTGRETGLRVAVAEDLTIGNLQFKNVAFLVMADSEAVFSRGPLNQQGALGLPIVLAFRTMRFSKDGTTEIGFAADTAPSAKPNLCFDGLDLVANIEFSRRHLPVVLDTGAEASEIWPPFAKEFPDVVSAGRTGSKMENGFAGQSSIAAKTVSELSLRIGGFDTRVRSAQVLLSGTTPNSEWYYARVGFDILSLAHEVTIDFERLVLSAQ